MQLVALKEKGKKEKKKIVAVGVWGWGERNGGRDGERLADGRKPLKNFA